MHLVTAFPVIITYLLYYEPALVHDVFTSEDICILLSGKDAKELEILLPNQFFLPQPLDVFLTSLISLSTQPTVRFNADAMVQ